MHQSDQERASEELSWTDDSAVFIDVAQREVQIRWKQWTKQDQNRSVLGNQAINPDIGGWMKLCACWTQSRGGRVCVGLDLFAGRSE